MNDDEQVEKFAGIVSRLAEHHDSFLVVAKGNNGGLLIRTNDRTWGIGAASRYLNLMNDEDKINERKSQEDN